MTRTLSVRLLRIDALIMYRWWIRFEMPLENGCCCSLTRARFGCSVPSHLPTERVACLEVLERGRIRGLNIPDS